MNIYLDNAATSFPKPESVYLAMDQFARTQAVAAGRGNYQRANDVGRGIDQARKKLAKLINAPSPSNIAFAFSGTDALSTAIFGFVKPGDHVVTTAIEHTSVLRPLQRLAETQNVTVSICDCDLSGTVETEKIVAMINQETRLVCISHASNVTGAVQEIDAIQTRCAETNTSLLIDAAQTVGHIPIDVQNCPCDFLAAPSHKGLLGPLGTGFLYVSDRVAEETSPLRFGGTGSSQIDDRQPTSLPDKFESGNMNGMGIAGLNAALDWLTTENARSQHETLQESVRALVDGLKSISGLTLYGLASGAPRASVVSFSIDGIDCHSVGMALDSQFGIECRTGFHCAPLLHKALGTDGTDDNGGLVRLSPGVFTTSTEISQSIDAIRSIAEAVHSSR